MSKTARSVAIILAGGTGSGVGLATPKQFIPVAGQSSLEHTVSVFDSAPGIDEIIVVMEPSHLQKAEEVLTKHSYGKLTAIISGGSTRNESSHLAIAKIRQSDAKVLFHDAVRPLVDHRIIQDCLDALDTYDAVDTAVASSDTIIIVDAQDHLASVPHRDSLRRGQTPQGFRYHVIAKAYEYADRDPAFQATDDCSVVLKYLPNVPIKVIDGSEANIKITNPVDIHLVDKLFQLREHRLSTPAESVRNLADQSIVVFGGSSGIGADLCLQLTRLGAHTSSFSRRETHTDVRNRRDIREALAEAYAEHGRIDHVVCNGWSPRGWTDS